MIRQAGSMNSTKAPMTCSRGAIPNGPSSSQIAL
jgi:hypothetical protein